MNPPATHPVHLPDDVRLRLEVVQRKYQADLARSRDELVRRARALAADLSRLADRLEADPARLPNPLGELQSSAHDLDRLCYQVHALHAVLADLRRLHGPEQT